jgi:hypothetical protein
VQVSGYVPTSREVIAGEGLAGGGMLNTNVTLRTVFSNATPSAGFQSGVAGVSTESSRSDHQHPAVDLAADDQVDGLLGLSNGGTAKSLVPDEGAIIWCGADGLYVGPVGGVGQIMQSTGAGEYQWVDSDTLAAASAANISGGLANQLVYQISAGDTGFVVSPVSADTFLKWNGTGFEWSAVAGAGTVTQVNTGTGLTGGPITSSGTLSIDSTVATLTGSQALTNKTISGSSNTLSNIGNSSLTNSSITFNGQTVSLGGSGTITAAAPYALTIGSGLSGTSYNGSAAVTITNSLPMVYPGAGIPNSTGSAWGTSYSTSGSGTVVALATGATLNNPTIGNYEIWTSTSAPSYAEGRQWYDSTAHSLAYYNDSANAVVHLGQDIQFKVINNTGSSIANGSPVYITSASSGQTYPNVALAKADVAGTATVIGLTNGAIANGAIGYVTAQGAIDNVNTGSFTVGQVLYLSPYSAGQLMNTLPPTGITVQVGVVTYVDASVGKIYVKQTTPLAVPASIITGTLGVANGGTGATTLTGYVKGSGTSAFTASSTVPTTDLSGTVTNAQLANSAITINGTSTSLGGSISVGTVTSVTGTAPVVSSGGATPAISMAAASTSTNGYLTSTDWNTFNGKGSGSVTSVSGTGTVSGISLSGTVTSSGSLTLGGTLDLSSPPAIGGTTPAAITGTTITGTKFVGINGGTF